jgi:hypothetical protein
VRNLDLVKKSGQSTNCSTTGVSVAIRHITRVFGENGHGSFHKGREREVRVMCKREE